MIYYDRIVKGRRVSFSTRTSDWNEAAAVRDLYEEKRRIGIGIAPPREAPRFSEFARRYLAESIGHLAPATQDDRRAMLGAESGLTRSLGSLRLDQITRATLMEWWTCEPSAESGQIGPMILERVPGSEGRRDPWRRRYRRRRPFERSGARRNDGFGSKTPLSPGREFFGWVNTEWCK